MADEITAGTIEDLAGKFDDMCNSRMQFGQEKYGDFTWLASPTMQMVLEEMADMVNYVRFSAVKVMLMAEYIAEEGEGLAQPSIPGNEGFVPSNSERV